MLWAGDEKHLLCAPSMPFGERWRVLSGLAELTHWEDSEVFSLLTTAIDRFEKVRMVRRLTESRAEGVIARRLDGVYRAGVRSHDVVKFKFVKTVERQT
jgi:ATP-dependent DNA ligase